MYNEKSYTELTEAISFFKNNFKSILIFTALGFLIPGSGLLLGERIYKIKTTIEIGYINSGDILSLTKERILDGSNFLSQLNSDYSDEKLDIDKKCRLYGSNYSIAVIGPSRLALSVIGSSHNQIMDCLDAFQKYLVKSDNDVLQNYLEKLNLMYKMNQALIAKYKFAENKSSSYSMGDIVLMSSIEQQNIKIELILNNIKNSYSTILKPYRILDITFEIILKRLFIGALTGFFLGILYAYIFKRARA